MIRDFSLEIVEVDGFPIQTFKHRFKSIPAMFQESAKTYGDKPFLAEGEKRLTFSETRGQVTHMAALLRTKYGIRKGHHVGILMENSINFIIGFLGIQQLGATAVVFNHHLTKPELERQIKISDLELLCLSPTFSDKIENINPDTLPEKILRLNADWITTLPREEGPVASVEIDEDSVALILFTSGTTGFSKGTMITHRNLITSAFKQGYYSDHHLRMKNREKRKTILVAPLFHVMAIQEQLMGAIFSGTTLFILPVFNADLYLDLIVRERINILTGTPTMFWLLLHKTPIQKYDVSCIEVVKYGGAPVAPDLLAEMKAIFKDVQFLNGYGSTEASVITLLLDEFCEQRPTSVGWPALCSEVKFVDSSGKELKANEVGELAVRGGLVSKGYYKLVEETKRVYRDGWFFTGDMGYQDEEGFIYLVGRSKEMINRGGEKVYPVEVENVLHLHPKILDVTVFGIPDPVMGECVGCAVVPRPGVHNLQLAEVQEFCKEKLAYYKIPQKIVMLPDLPRNPGGKVIKKSVLEKYLSMSSQEKHV
ncbi:MAG: class I adenylate-forming enzyme family protein [Thermodesulfobacteriota bacterium]|nr:class I adenylate-forming enzyme family protein [Thermodesulfobacteriota bacterium]